MGVWAYGGVWFWRLVAGEGGNEERRKRRRAESGCRDSCHPNTQFFRLTGVLPNQSSSTPIEDPYDVSNRLYRPPRIDPPSTGETKSR